MRTEQGPSKEHRLGTLSHPSGEGDEVGPAFGAETLTRADRQVSGTHPHRS